MSPMLHDIEDVEVIVDDLVVWGEHVEQQDGRQVLDCCQEWNLKLNKEKYRFRVA